jgi:rod shape-determining protein MreD
MIYYRRVGYWFFIALFLQWALAPVLQWRGVRPDFILLFILYLALYTDPLAAMSVGLFLGLLKDGLEWGPFGLSSLIYVITGYVPHLFRGRLYLDSVATQLSFVIVFTLLGEFVRSSYYILVGQQAAVAFSLRLGVHLFWNILWFWILFRHWSWWIGRQRKMGTL